MSLLIDGHNLIQAMPDIDIADPHDEALLVEKLKRYCARVRKRCTVIFDGGLPGGEEKRLSSGQVKVVFAPAHSDADTLIKQRVRKATNPGALTVVSSDREIQAAAQSRRAQVVDSATFAQHIEATLTPSPEEPEEDEAQEHYPDAAEVDEFLRMFRQRDADHDPKRKPRT